MEREVGGGIGMGNTCKPLAVSFQCMTKSTTNKKKKKKRKKKTKQKKKKKRKDHRDLLFLCKGHWDSESLSASAAVTQLVNCRSGSAVQISELAVHALLAPRPTKD